jgi:hypothetical protein
MARGKLCGTVLGLLLVGCTASQADPTLDERVSAVRATVSSNALCSARRLGSYYWEIGDQAGELASGRVTNRRQSRPVSADTTLNIASASKWLYAAYVLERVGDLPDNRPWLNMTSGYSNFRASKCPTDGTVASCDPGDISLREAVGRTFHYDGGHMQRHAIDNGLGPLSPAELAPEIGAYIGDRILIDYVQPGIAGGGRTTARRYAGFLRKLLPGSDSPLVMAELLGSEPVCTWPSDTCDAARLVAVPEAWHYTLGHWIEDDPATTPAGNFAYSSPGSFGFYPWVDVDRTWYGILARETAAFTGQDEGYASVQCGRLLRWAWKTGLTQ